MKNQQPTIAILACWAVTKFKSEYYISGLRADYLKHFCKLCSHVYLIAPTRKVPDSHLESHQLERLCYANLSVIELPPLPVHWAYISSLVHAKNYYDRIIEVKQKATHFYCQTPDPFCWLPSLLDCPNVTMHHVGSSVDATWHSSRPFLIRLILVVFYFPEFCAIRFASRKSRVLCNGQTISDRLNRYGVSHKTLISSTINESDLKARQILCYSENNVHSANVELLYVGYLRPSKGLKVIVRAIASLRESQLFPFRLRIVGDGEEKRELKSLVNRLDLHSHIDFVGHIDDRRELRKIYESSDIFLFMSTSEGSPRVVVEAMASSLLVISNRVGSLPHEFTNKEHLIFVENSAQSLYTAINHAVANREKSSKIGLNAFYTVKKRYMQHAFIKQLISDD